MEARAAVRPAPSEPVPVSSDTVAGWTSSAKRAERATCVYVAQDERFLLPPQRGFERQYAPLYYCRLQLLHPIMAQSVAHTWPGVEVAKILAVGEAREVAVIGTLYKGMRLKPSILDEYSGDAGLQQALGGACFCSDDDSLVLEDEGARMSLRSACQGLQPDCVVTGVVVALRGAAEPGGDFVVTDLLWPGLPEQPQRPLHTEDRYLVLASGLQLAGGPASLVQAQLLVDFLTGNLGASPQQQLAAQVVQLIVAGGSLGQLAPPAAAHAEGRQQSESARDLDLLMTELAASLPVDIMPGAEDPSNASLPQQPLHQCLFAGAAAYRGFRRVTNPHACQLGGVALLGTSGQNLDDLAKYTRGGSRLDLLTACLRWRHLCPSAPDTLTCYPYADDDPFVLRECPHLLFAGNQPRFATQLLQGPAGQRVRLVCVPSFASSGVVVLVNLRTLDCQEVQFRAS